ncbi:DUF6338 family protein [Candidatus Poriferisocius sp.]|uniref:DUF6338 family protein n=1 Tax=Candidatus Poriferisocius sp. TaxID=3101276 RepID=UPI003B02526B
MFGAFLSLVILGFIILPGISYRTGRELGRQTKGFPGFRETALLLFPGIVAVAGGLGVFAGIRAWFPDHTPNVGEFAEDYSGYFSDHYLYLLWWGVLIMAGSCLGAFGFGKLITWIDDKRAMTIRSAWGNWLTYRWYRPKKEDRYGDKDTATFVECYLTDGSVIAGYVESFNAGLEETQERDICLHSIMYWPPDMDMDGPPLARGSESDTFSGPDPARAIISAKRINFMLVSYVRIIPGEDPIGYPI